MVLESNLFRGYRLTCRMVKSSWISVFPVILVILFAFCSAKVGDVRLSGGAKWYGRVDMNMPGWYTVCDTDWDEADARVVCRQLGFRHGIALCCGAVGYNYKRAQTNRVHCTGNESRLMDCPSSPPTGADTACHSRNYASVLCHNRDPEAGYTDILIGTSRQPSGDVDLRYMGINGTICSDGWDDVDASVACREAGYPDGYAYHHYRGWIIRSGSANPGPYWTSNVTCTGNETKLSECQHVAMGTVRECRSGHHAGALCHTSDIEFRITGGENPRAGRVEVSVNGVWGSLCNHDWHSIDATVLCRQFGYVGGAISTMIYTNPPNAMFINAPQCSGREEHMLDCPHRSWRNVERTDTQCSSSHRSDVAVKCHGPVRLHSTRGGNPIHGPVTFFRNGNWYPVCDTGFDDYTARLACVDMGFMDGRAICCSAYGLPWTRLKFNSYRVSCDRGNERAITDCVKEIPCNSTHYASVVCFRQSQLPMSDAYAFSATESSAGRGQVVVDHYGIVGRVCVQSWSDTEAKVLCKSLGYPAGIAYHHTLHGQTRAWAPYMISNVTCTGRETALSQCDFHSRLELGECYTQRVAGVLCLNQTADIQYRIVGPIPNSGRVEVGVDGVWGTVCNTWWGAEEATVLCRQLNYTAGGFTPSTENITSTASGPHWLSHLQCFGSESSLHDCPHVGFATEVGDRITMYPNGSIRWDAACDSHEKYATVHCNLGSTTVAPITTPIPTSSIPTTTISTTRISTSAVTTTTTTTTPSTTTSTTQKSTTTTPTTTPTPSTATSTTPTTTTTYSTTSIPTPLTSTTQTQATQSPATARQTSAPSQTTSTSRASITSATGISVSTDSSAVTTTPYETTYTSTGGNGTYQIGKQKDDDNSGVNPVIIIVPILAIIIVICIAIFVVVYIRHKRNKKRPRRGGPRDDRIMFAYDADSNDWSTIDGNNSNNSNFSATVLPNNGVMYSEPVIDYAFYDKDSVQFGSFGRASNADSGRGSPSQLYNSIPIRRQPSVVRFAEDNTYIDESLPVAEPSLYYNIGQSNADDIPPPRMSNA